MATKEELLERSLPKWPQMIVTGTSLPVDQALEIIRRTDTFFIWGGGNDHEFIDQAKKFAHMPEAPDRSDPKWKDNDDAWGEAFRKYWEEENPAWEKKWNLVHLNYVFNSWVSCSYINGPHGWCHPDGSIGFTDNVGKWPSVKEVLEDWETLAREFPFIEVEVTLTDGEYCEEDTSRVVSFLVRGGKVEVVDPEERNLHEEFNRTVPVYDEDSAVAAFMEHLLAGRAAEHAISLEQVKKWSEEVWGDGNV